MFTRGDEDTLAGWLAEEVCPVELRDEAARTLVNQTQLKGMIVEDGALVLQLVHHANS